MSKAFRRKGQLLSEPEPHLRRAIISWSEVRAWSRGGLPEPADPPARGWRRLDIDGVFAFALFISILFGAASGGMSAAIFVGLTAAYATVRFKDLLRILGPRLFLLIPAAVAVASSQWSELPEESLRQGLALTLTLSAALLLSAARSPGAVFRGVTGAYLVYLITARALGASMQGGMGDIGATSALVALGVVVMAVRERSWPWSLAGALAAAFEISALAQAKPAGAMLGLGVALAVMVLLAAVLHAKTWVRAVVTLTVASGAVLVGLYARLIAILMTEHGRGLVAANPNLQLISDGWDQARALIVDQKLLGKGFYGLWPTSTIEAAHTIAPGKAPVLAIHNSYIDILLQLGWLGLWIVGAILLVAGLAFVRRFMRRPNLALVIWAGLLVYELVRIQVDVIGYAPFSPSAVLLTASLAATFAPELGERPTPKPAPRPPLPPASVTHLSDYRERQAAKPGRAG